MKSGARCAIAQEGSAINESLSSLISLVDELSSAAQAVRQNRKDLHPDRLHARLPRSTFQLSKLTQLLQETLVGNCLSYMVACVAPAASSRTETVATLRFASNLRKLQTLPVQNVQVRDLVVGSLKSEVAEARKCLQLYEMDALSGDLPTITLRTENSVYKEGVPIGVRTVLVQRGLRHAAGSCKRDG